MKKTKLILMLLVTVTCAFGQDIEKETLAVKKTINTLFDGMRKGDSTMVRSTFASDVIMQTILSKDGRAQVRTGAASEFLKAVGTPHPDVWDERITFDQVLIDASLASVWTSYSFYLGERFSHCGVNSFQLVKLDNKWKIVHLIDTRRKDNCH